MGLLCPGLPGAAEGHGPYLAEAAETCPRIWKAFFPGACLRANDPLEVRVDLQATAWLLSLGQRVSHSSRGLISAPRPWLPLRRDWGWDIVWFSDPASCGSFHSKKFCQVSEEIVLFSLSSLLSAVGSLTAASQHTTWLSLNLFLSPLMIAATFPALSQGTVFLRSMLFSMLSQNPHCPPPWGSLGFRNTPVWVLSSH